MMVQSVNGVNLGSRIKVEIGNLNEFEIIGRGLQRVYDSWRVTGAWFSGDWQGVIRDFRTMKSRMKQSLENANRVVAVMYYHDVQGAWETQEFASTWQPLNPNYLAQKIADQLDRRTLIRSGDALASLGVELEEDLSLVVGVTVEDDQGEAYMVTQEFGSTDGTIPARPLFFPVLEAQQDRYIRVFLDAIEKTLTGGIYTNFAAGVIS